MKCPKEADPQRQKADYRLQRADGGGLGLTANRDRISLELDYSGGCTTL